MKNINKFIVEHLEYSTFPINEKLRISSKYYKQYQPQNVNELRKILEERLAEDKNANLNDIDVSDITNMHAIITDSKGSEKHGLFYELDPHNIDISQWDVSKVTDMAYMFYDCENLNCDLGNWDISNVKRMECMFKGCEHFIGKGLENWDVSKVKKMNKFDMFAYCISLKNRPKGI